MRYDIMASIQVLHGEAVNEEAIPRGAGLSVNVRHSAEVI
jgi:hypothetical protein